MVPTRPLSVLTVAGLCTISAAAVPSLAWANPGTGRHLAGVEEQGPASKSLTALHHNPAMLARLPGLQFSTNGRIGLDHETITRSTIDGQGLPTASFGDAATVFNPLVGYFLGASFQLEPIAIGAGVYDLSSRYSPNSADNLRYHLVADPDYGCLADTTQACPQVRSGGAEDVRTDYTVSVAGSILGRLFLGVSFHFPRWRVGFARDIDTAVESSEGEEGSIGCGEVQGVDPEDPRCSERLSFRGRTRLRLFGLSPDETASTFDFAMTFGVAVEVVEGVTLGARYRTQPLLNGGQVVASGQALVCLPDLAAQTEFSDVPACTEADPVTATVSEVLPRELALGGSFTFDPVWSLDVGLSWTDACPGGIRPGECDNNDARRLKLVGLDRDAAVLPDGPVYRGRQDIYAAELYARYRAWRVARSGLELPRGGQAATRTELIFGASVYSPGTQPGALTVASPDGWTVGASLGAAFEIPRARGSFFVVPGYALDVRVPMTVGPGGSAAAFDPEATSSFNAANGDLNDPSAAAVLDGRARPTNAGRYAGASHTFVLSFRWAERMPGQR